MRTLLALWMTVFLAVILFVDVIKAQKSYSIAEVQGSGNTSPHVGESVTLYGVVTARTRTGFFLQSPDDRSDKDPATAEGIFVFTKNAPPADILVGSLVTISGEVQEYRGRNDLTSLTTTELSHRLGQDSYKVEGKDAALPKPIVLSANDFVANSIDELERYEGMRVSLAEITVVAPTEGRVDIKTASAVSDGVFFGVLKGLARPCREPGLDIRELNAMPDRDKARSAVPKLQVWDANPEIIRIDTLEQQLFQRAQLDERAERLGITGAISSSGQTLEAPALSEIKGLTGVLHYAFGRYTLLKDPANAPVAAVPGRVAPLPAPTDHQFSIAGMNLENFFDDVDDPDIKEDVLTPEAFARRLKKVSVTIRDLLRTPDIIGVVEIENLSTLKRLAERINADAVAAGNANPKYVAYLEEGNDGRGIDIGFLVRPSRVKVIEVQQLGKANRFKNPDTGDDEFLNDRPPLMLRVAIDDANSGKPYEMTLIVNHLKSFLGYSDPKQMANVRLKKRLQAEFLARVLQERLQTDPKEKIVLLGDFNAFQFNDGVMDVIGTIKGMPADKGSVLMPSPDLLDPDMIDLVDVIDPKQRYSYTFDGSAQAIDHMIISPALVGDVKGFGYLRVNADYPESYRNDDSRPERYSDHDPAIALFSLDGR